MLNPTPPLTAGPRAQSKLETTGGRTGSSTGFAPGTSDGPVFLQRLSWGGAVRPFTVEGEGRHLGGRTQIQLLLQQRKHKRTHAEGYTARAENCLERGKIHRQTEKHLTALQGRDVMSWEFTYEVLWHYRWRNKVKVSWKTAFLHRFRYVLTTHSSRQREEAASRRKSPADSLTLSGQDKPRQMQGHTCHGGPDETSCKPNWGTVCKITSL